MHHIFLIITALVDVGITNNQTNQSDQSAVIVTQILKLHQTLSLSMPHDWQYDSSILNYFNPIVNDNDTRCMFADVLF